MIKESQIVYENGIYWVLKIKRLFEVRQNLNSYSIGYGYTDQIDKAKKVCDNLAKYQPCGIGRI